MEQNRYLFYTHRLKTGVLAVLSFVLAYIIKTKLLDDSGLLTDSSVMIFRVMFILSIVMGILVLFKTLDPRPILEISPTGVAIQSFLFTKVFIPWNEIESVNNENWRQVIVNKSGFAMSNTRMLRFKRTNGRSVAVNLTLLNTKGVDVVKLLSSTSLDS